MPFFTILTCTYTRAALLPRAIASVQAQTFVDWELIVVDDGSTDGTQQLLDGMFAGDARMRTIRIEHGGLARARNAGIAAARGMYVTFLDSDDAYEPAHLAERAAFLAAHPDVQLLHGGVTVIGDPFVADKNDPARRVAIADCVVGGTFVVHRELFSTIGAFPDVAYGDDAAFFERARLAQSVIARIDAPTYRYHRGESDSLCVIAESQGMAGVAAFQGRR